MDGAQRALYGLSTEGGIGGVETRNLALNFFAFCGKPYGLTLSKSL